MRPLIALILAVPLVAAGCVNAPEVETAATDADALAGAGTLVETPFSFDGQFGTGVVACPVVACIGSVQAASTWKDLDIAGNLTATALTMTWDAMSPSMSTLRFGISWNEGEGFEYVEGTSPLVLELDGLTIAASDEPYMWAWIVSPVPMGVVTVSTPQDFHVEGTLSVEEASA